MPQASDTDRALMAKWFPRGINGTSNDSGIDDGCPAHFLRSRGWIDRGGIWYKPTPSYNPSIYEVACLLFLRDEWDYDFIRPLYPELPNV